MKRNTATTFGSLHCGDRFYFPGDKARKTYQLTGESLDKPTYNIITSDGKKAWSFDRNAARDRMVIFLRHTIPQTGEECMLYDLKVGDIFFFPEDVVTELAIVSIEGLNPHEKYLVATVNDDITKLFWQSNLPVFYVRGSQVTPAQERLIETANFNL